MRKYLKDLKPSRFEDLIAMVSLYRPGPMKYIPSFINRKHGIEEIEYDLPIMEEILKETYGITVYQEQVMLLSRKLAGFTRGQSDSLRKAMGKKKLEEMAKLNIKFTEGCVANGFPKEKIDKVWKDWEEFAKYAFNKSHATCYAHLAYQTGYLKAHYPAEFMAANLSRNLNDIKKITQLIGEANHMDIQVTRPDVNESALDFTVTKEGVIRFGMAAIKGVGGAAVEQIVKEREENGLFKSIFDFAKRVNLRSVNKRSFEALAMAGAFDGFPNTHRAQYFYKENETAPEFIEIVIKHGSRFQEKNNSSQVSLFGGMDDAFEILDPPMPQAEPWSLIKMLRLEKQVTGFYISGHPLDEFKFTMERYCNIEIAELKDNLPNYDKQTVMFAGMIADSQQRTSKNGAPFGIFSIEDFSGTMSFMLFNEEYLKRKHMLEIGNKVFVVATIEERRHQPGNFDIRVGDIFLLTEAMSKLAKSVILSVSALDIDDALIEKLAFLAKENEGNCAIELKIDDPEDGKILSMKSSKLKVEPRSFIHEIDKLKKLKFSIN
jgi:DNA polymerase-3 subunit alpha